MTEIPDKKFSAIALAQRISIPTLIGALIMGAWIGRGYVAELENVQKQTSAHESAITAQATSIANLIRSSDQLLQSTTELNRRMDRQEARTHP